MGVSIWQLLIVLAIVLVLFGAKRLRGLGGDLGHAVRGFRDAMKEGEHGEAEASEQKAERHIDDKAGDDRVIDGEVVKDKDRA